MTESDLFGNPPPQEELCALDEMFGASLHYRNSREYKNLLRFIAKFPNYSPFNCFLLHVQRPEVSYVALRRVWLRKFNRTPKRDASPLVILAPMSPVLFVYDLKDTEGQDVPEKLLRPFKTDGKLAQAVFDKTMHNCAVHDIAVSYERLGHFHGGGAGRITAEDRKQLAPDALKRLPPGAQYIIILNRELPLEDKYAALVHELGHIFCGHCGIDKKAWWVERSGQDKSVVEVEAESIAWLVCQRKGLQVNAAEYLSGYVQGQIPPISLNAVFQVSAYIEAMGRDIWTEPARKSRYASKTAQAVDNVPSR